MKSGNLTSTRPSTLVLVNNNIVIIHFLKIFSLIEPSFLEAGMEKKDICVHVSLRSGKKQARGVRKPKIISKEIIKWTLGYNLDRENRNQEGNQNIG